MKMFVFYFTVFFVDPNGSEYSKTINSFVYKNQEECKTAEFLIIGGNEINNCLAHYDHHTSNNPQEIEATILKYMANDFNSRIPKKNDQ